MSKLGDAGIGMGVGAASGIIGAGMGLLLQKQNDARQINQQRKLNEMQIEGQKEMGMFNQKQQMEMWNNTNYEAQKEHMQKAGLNPGLMYGMGGGGGATAGAGGSNAVAGGQAPSGGGEIGMGMQTAMQMALMKAQKENIEADTANKQAGTENTATQTAGNKIDTYVKEQTQNESIDRILADASKAQAEAAIAGRNNEIDEKTAQDRIKTIQQEAINKALEGVKGTQDVKIKKAEAIIKGFEAENAKQGISTNAPWYLKMVADILGRIGINPLK